MILRGFVKAARLEFNQLSESKVNLLLLIIVPILVVSVFAISADNPTAFNPNIRNYDFFAPTVLALVTLFISTQLTILRIVGERSPYGTLDRDLLAISRSGMYLGKLFTNAVIAFFQCFLVFLLVTTVFKITILGNSFSILLILLLTSLVGLSMGMFFSVFSKTKEQAIQLVPFSIIILFILAGAFIPVSKMPEFIGIPAKISPLALSYNALMNTIMPFVLEDKEKVGMIWSVMGLLAWSFSFIFLGLIKFIFERR